MSLIPHTLLFEWKQSVAKIPASWSEGRWKSLPEKHRIVNPGALDDKPEFAELRVGWNDAGMRFDLIVSGKKNAPDCSAKDPMQADGLQLWIDTRNTPGVHRANRFCHLIVAHPTGGGTKGSDPHAQMLEIHRCREKSPLASPDQFQVKSSLRKDGYTLQLWLPAELLNGFDPEQSPAIGFFYAVRDAELGLQTLASGEEFPYHTDPSLWQELELA